MRNLLLPFVLVVTSACGGPGSPPGGVNPSGSTAAASAAPSSALPDTSGAATAPAPSGPAPDEAALLGGWVHLREHDEGDTQHWVPAGTDVPPSRFRDAFTLEKGGKAKILCLAPNDAHQVFDGTWSVGPGGRLDLDVTCFGGERPMHFVVVETTAKLLRLKVAG